MARPQHPRHKEKIALPCVQRKTSLQSSHLEKLVAHSRCWNQTRFYSSLASGIKNFTDLIPGIDERFTDSDRWQNMTRGATTADNCETGHLGLRATFIKSPQATIETISDVPPKEMNGKVNPVTGRRPTTPPTLITNCSRNQEAIPPASNRPKR